MRRGGTRSPGGQPSSRRRPVDRAARQQEGPNTGSPGRKALPRVRGAVRTRAPTGAPGPRANERQRYEEESERGQAHPTHCGRGTLPVPIASTAQTGDRFEFRAAHCIRPSGSARPTTTTCTACDSVWTIHASRQPEPASRAHGRRSARRADSAAGGPRRRATPSRPRAGRAVCPGRPRSRRAR